MDSDAPLGAQTSNRSASDSVRSWVASFLTYLKLRLSLLGLESKEAGLHLLVLALLFAGTLVFFCRLPCNADGFSALSRDVSFPLGLGLERARLWRVTSLEQHRRWRDPPVPNRQTAFPGYTRRA